MKLKSILINILALPVWLIYYFCTMPFRNLFITPPDDGILLILFVLLTVYNVKVSKAIGFLLKNGILTSMLAIALYVEGFVYLEYFPHMSDEHSAVPSITADILIYFVKITAIVFVVKLIVDRVKKINSEKMKEDI